MWNKIINQKSFTLLEVLIAVFFLTAGIFGAYTVIQQTLINTSVSVSKLTAAYLAQEGIEIVRNIRDTNWLEDRSVSTSWDDGLVLPIIDCRAGCEADYNDSNLSSYNGNPLYIETISGMYGYDSGTPTPFTRKITITPNGTDILEVLVNVSWQEGPRTLNVAVQENLYNWK